MINRQIHLWWDTTPVPDPVENAATAWQDLHPTWAVHIWTDEPIIGLARHTARQNLTSVFDDDHVRHYANQVRWHLLARYGGVWVDCDTTPLHPLDDLLDADTPFCASAARPEATVIGGPFGHPLWPALIAESARPHTQTTAPFVSGSHALTRVLPAHPDVRVLEPGAFFETGSNGAPIPVPATSPRYSTHAWGTSSQRHRSPR